MKIFYEVRHFSPKFTSSLVRKQYCQKRFLAIFLPFLAQKFERKKNLSKSVSGYYKTKKKLKKKKSGMDH